MKNALTANFGLKLLAVFFAVAIWFVAVNINDPVDKTVFRNIPVEIQNADLVTKAGKVYAIRDESDVIDVTVWAKRSILDTLGRENIIATADMQNLSINDTSVNIKLATNKYNDKLESIKGSSESLLVDIEDLEVKQIMLGIFPVGEVADGYMLGDVLALQNLVRISGPKSVVDAVKSASVAVDVSGLTQNVRTESSVRLFSAANTIIDDSNIKKSFEQITVAVEILQKKTVPVVAKVSGEVAEGYGLTDELTISPATVDIAGNEDVIADITRIVIPDGAVSVEGQSSTLNTKLDIREYLGRDVRFADPEFDGRVSIIVGIEKIVEKELILPTDRISITGVPEGCSAAIRAEDDAVALSFKALESHIGYINPQTVTAAVNIEKYMQSRSLEKLEPGIYDIEAELILPEAATQVGDSRVKVLISRDREDN